MNAYGRILALVVIAVLIACAGCKHKQFAPPAGAALEDVFSIPNPSSDTEMICRIMPAYLDELDALMKKNKYDVQLVARASGAHFGYAFCCLEDTDPAQASEIYLRGRDLSLAELRRYSFFDQSFDDSLARFKKALLYNFDKRNIQHLYWTAMNWFGWVTLNMSDPNAKGDLQKVAAMLEYVVKLDRTYGGGTVYAVLGSIHAILDDTEGGDADLAKQEFENAELYSGNSLLAVQVLKARWLSVRLNDRTSFENTLKAVLNTPLDQFPDRTFVNLVARQRAALLLEKAERLFPKG
mgnify:FL=1